MSPYKDSRSALSYVSRDKKKAAVFVYQTGNNRDERVKLKGLDPAKNYVVKELNLEEDEKSGFSLNNKTITGKELMTDGFIPVCKKELESMIIGLNVDDIEAQENTRWKMNENNGIRWETSSEIPHDDHIEMSGKQLSVVLRYGVDSKQAFVLNRSIVWPMLRFEPNKTRSHLNKQFALDIRDFILVNNQSLGEEKTDRITLEGLMVVESKFPENNLQLTRILFPSTFQPVYIEKYILKNAGKQNMNIDFPDVNMTYITDASTGIYGGYTYSVSGSHKGFYSLQPGAELIFYMRFFAHKTNEVLPVVDSEQELVNRKNLINEIGSKLVLETPDPVLNTTFAFAKVRGSESIYQTKGGLMHGPGGEAYYAAIWANDQAEYINPFFPFLGYDTGNESALNAFRHFARFMNDEYKPIPSSIIAEGDGIWHGAKDRGDCAMIAYGAARYALARGNKAEAQELWPLIEWCLEYCKRQLNKDGVVKSNSDELENRFPSGDANLCTSGLYYDALISASYLGRDLGKSSSLLNTYKKESEVLKKAIETHFGYEVEGFHTYRYYEGNDILRAWICIPLTVGIFDRSKGTVDALFSPRLWTDDGLLTQAGTKTFWDRSTLYALRGIFAAGAKEKGLDYLKRYSIRRLLGEHVPYAIEAWPEGSQRHLSAESGLYCRIYTEGIFGIRPTGLHSFELCPQLPDEWNFMNLKSIHCFEQIFDVNITRKNDKLEVVVKNEEGVVVKKQIKSGEHLSVTF
ncbi:MAG: GH36 C-terminal domain-containing protein [Dysgonamonadaceae bacterium]|nr:GH36 C-terminal domain-containing protein [Dysgonamonadaceae bacterium]